MITSASDFATFAALFTLLVLLFAMIECYLGTLIIIFYLINNNTLSIVFFFEYQGFIDLNFKFKFEYFLQDILKKLSSKHSEILRKFVEGQDGK